jgi:hypothetical protein
MRSKCSIQSTRIGVGHVNGQADLHMARLQKNCATCWCKSGDCADNSVACSEASEHKENESFMGNYAYEKPTVPHPPRWRLSC